MQSAQAQVAGLAEAEAALNGCRPMKNWRSRIRNKFWAMSAPPLQYSPGLRRNNKAI